MNKIAVISKKDDNKYFSNRNYKSLTENNVIAMVQLELALTVYLIKTQDHSVTRVCSN